MRVGQSKALRRADDKKTEFHGEPVPHRQSVTLCIHRKGKKKGHVAPSSQPASGQTAGEEVADELVVFERSEEITMQAMHQNQQDA